MISGCAALTGIDSKALAKVRKVAVVNAATGMTRFHRGITMFDNVLRRQPEPKIDKMLLDAVSAGLGHRFQVVNVHVPDIYIRSKPGFLAGQLPPVAGVDAIAVIRPSMNGLSEPAVAMQGYGLHSSRIINNVSCFIHAEITLQDSAQGKLLASYPLDTQISLPDMAWKADWSDYSPKEKQAIWDGFMRLLDAVRLQATDVGGR